MIREPALADVAPIAEVMSRGPVASGPDATVEELARLMTEGRIGCIPVVDQRGVPHGIVTRFDLVEDFAKARHGRTARDMMMPMALTLDEHATVAHAAEMMALEDTHHVMIVATDGGLIGVVSSMDIVRWLVAHDGLHPR